MPDAFGRLTEEEKWAQAQASLAPGQTAGMGMPTLTPEQMQILAQDFSAEDSKVKRQQQMASEMRGRGQDRFGGKSLNTEFGELYMGPNWGDIVAGIGESYLSGRTDKKAEGLAKATADKRAEQNAVRGTFEQNKDIYAEDVRQEAEDYGRNRDLISDKQWQDTFDYNKGRDRTDDAQWREKQDASMLETELPSYRDIKTNEPLKIGWRRKDGRMMPYNLANGDDVDPTNLELIDDAAGGYSSGAVKSIKTYHSLDPSMPPVRTGIIGDKEYNLDTQMPITQQDLYDGGYQAALSPDKLATELGKFDKKTEKVRQLADKFNIANEVLDKYEIDIFGGENPLGPLQGAPGFIGGSIRTLDDLMSQDAQAGETFGAMNDVIAQIVRAQAGLSQTEKEIQTISDTYGRNWYDNPQLLTLAWPRLQRLIQADIKANMAGTHGQVISTYRQNMGREGGVDWTKIGVGLDDAMPPVWWETDEATAAARQEVDRRGRPKEKTNLNAAAIDAELADIDAQLRALEDDDDT